MSNPRTRYSIQYLQQEYDNGNQAPLETVIRAFQGIQNNPPTNTPNSPDTNSFFDIAGYHGEPFRGENSTTIKDPNYWGGYCNHGNVLFPTWHRAYVLRLEGALGSVAGCENVALPFWDECATHGSPSENPVPSVLTQPTFVLDGNTIPNPLYSYSLQKALDDQARNSSDEGVYVKALGYPTVRYPLSGIVGSLSGEAKLHAEAWNLKYTTAPELATSVLNKNVNTWLNGTTGLGTPPPDAILSDFTSCLQAPNYTVFSNTSSAYAWNNDPTNKAQHVVPIEQPHNDMHLAVGGFYMPGPDGFDADPGQGDWKIPNGDMGENNTAAFDPIFFLHHCFIDYVFWTWQKKNGFTAKGSLTVTPGYPGTIAGGTIPDGGGTVAWLPYESQNSALDTSTELYPFWNKLDNRAMNSDDVTDITGLGYNYGPGSLDPGSIILKERTTQSIHSRVKVHNVNRGSISGSFVIRIHALTPSGRKIEAGRQGVLSRWNVASCANCQTHLEASAIFPISHGLAAVLREDGKDEDVKYVAQLHTHHGLTTGNPKTNEGPQIIHIPA